MSRAHLGLFPPGLRPLCTRVMECPQSTEVAKRPPSIGPSPDPAWGSMREDGGVLTARICSAIHLQVLHTHHRIGVPDLGGREEAVPPAVHRQVRWAGRRSRPGERRRWPVQALLGHPPQEVRSPRAQAPARSARGPAPLARQQRGELPRGSRQAGETAGASPQAPVRCSRPSIRTSLRVVSVNISFRGLIRCTLPASSRSSPFSLRSVR